MLTRADIDKARMLFRDRNIAQGALDNLATQRVALMVGEGKDANEIVLKPAYLKQIVGDISASLNRQIAEINAALTAMGVEP
ncbi:hypothetical protein X740_33660 [Mesorhizobium sp. LNHC221B00]|uniref:hypothetical protein n=1 Tax=Mesorhizobium sp. LNHC221B00 TaxID=1287233 RepID=UPI0003CECFBB|nr:hypothetical protein [Mesorhizobium sp. LNHC221B00]ESY71761.1 hypothetical protein X740_33660 [Mesorhizobium sp. LNHC221B00]